jgi:hypothetical protein
MPVYEERKKKVVSSLASPFVVLMFNISFLYTDYEIRRPYSGMELA